MSTTVGLVGPWAGGREDLLEQLRVHTYFQDADTAEALRLRRTISDVIDIATAYRDERDAARRDLDGALERNARLEATVQRLEELTQDAADHCATTPAGRQR